MQFYCLVFRTFLKWSTEHSQSLMFTTSARSGMNPGKPGTIWYDKLNSIGAWRLHLITGRPASSLCEHKQAVSTYYTYDILYLVPGRHVLLLYYLVDSTYRYSSIFPLLVYMIPGMPYNSTAAVGTIGQQSVQDANVLLISLLVLYVQQ